MKLDWFGWETTLSNKINLCTYLWISVDIICRLGCYQTKQEPLSEHSCDDDDAIIQDHLNR